MLTIDPDKVCHIIVKARALERQDRAGLERRPAASMIDDDMLEVLDEATEDATERGADGVHRRPQHRRADRARGAVLDRPRQLHQGGVGARRCARHATPMAGARPTICWACRCSATTWPTGWPSSATPAPSDAPACGPAAGLLLLAWAHGAVAGEVRRGLAAPECGARARHPLLALPARTAMAQRPALSCPLPAARPWRDRARLARRRRARRHPGPPDRHRRSAADAGGHAGHGQQLVRRQSGPGRARRGGDSVPGRSAPHVDRTWRTDARREAGRSPGCRWVAGVRCASPCCAPTCSRPRPACRAR